MLEGIRSQPTTSEGCHTASTPWEGAKILGDTVLEVLDEPWLGTNFGCSIAARRILKSARRKGTYNRQQLAGSVRRNQLQISLRQWFRAGESLDRSSQSQLPDSLK